MEIVRVPALKVSLHKKIVHRKNMADDAMEMNCDSNFSDNLPQRPANCDLSKFLENIKTHKTDKIIKFDSGFHRVFGKCRDP